ncbi:MAG: protein kinase [Polyangiaceae bacterium]
MRGGAPGRGRRCRGGVPRALDRATGERVALKVLRPPSSRDIERFAREARVLSRLRHPAIVRYVSHGVTGEGEPFMAMEWLDEGGPVGPALARAAHAGGSAEVVRRAAAALAIPHARGIVHRDIKPSNLFLRNGPPGRS